MGAEVVVADMLDIIAVRAATQGSPVSPQQEVDRLSMLVYGAIKVVALARPALSRRSQVANARSVILTAFASCSGADMTKAESRVTGGSSASLDCTMG
jgi:hypothetical protein